MSKRAIGLGILLGNLFIGAPVIGTWAASAQLPSIAGVYLMLLPLVAISAVGMWLWVGPDGRSHFRSLLRDE